MIKSKKLYDSIYYLIQDDQGFSNLHIPEFETYPISILTIFNSVNKTIKILQQQDINPLSIEIYSGELIKEELIFQMIYQENKTYVDQKSEKIMK
jgi:hypothetical protein